MSVPAERITFEQEQPLACERSAVRVLLDGFVLGRLSERNDCWHADATGWVPASDRPSAAAHA